MMQNMSHSFLILFANVGTAIQALSANLARMAVPCQVSRQICFHKPYDI